MYLRDGAVTAIVLTGGYYYSSYPFFFHLYLGGVGCSRFARCGADLRSARTLRLHTSNKVHIDNGVASRHIENGITNRPEPLCLHLLEQAVRRVPAGAHPRTSPACRHSRPRHRPSRKSLPGIGIRLVRGRREREVSPRTRQARSTSMISPAAISRIVPRTTLRRARGPMQRLENTPSSSRSQCPATPADDSEPGYVIIHYSPIPLLTISTRKAGMLESRNEKEEYYTYA